MPGRIKCPPECACRKHDRSNQPPLSPDEKRDRQRETSREFYAANREVILERARARRRDPVEGEELRARERERVANLSPEERERRAQLSRDWYSRNPRPSAKHTEQHLRFRYGMTLEDRQRMLDDQDGRCYLCDDPLDVSQPRKIHVDHDHSCCPGSRSCGHCIRGLNCEHCNRGIGSFYDDPDRLRRVADALEAANARVRDRRQPRLF